MYVSILASGQGIRDINLPLVYFGDELGVSQPGFHITSGVMNADNRYNLVNREPRTILISGFQHLYVDDFGFTGQVTNLDLKKIKEDISAMRFVIKPYVLNMYDTSTIDRFLFPKVIFIDDCNFVSTKKVSTLTKSKFYFDSDFGILYIPYFKFLDIAEMVGSFSTDE